MTEVSPYEDDRRLEPLRQEIRDRMRIDLIRLQGLEIRRKDYTETVDHLLSLFNVLTPWSDEWIGIK